MAIFPNFWESSKINILYFLKNLSYFSLESQKKIKKYISGNLSLGLIDLVIFTQLKNETFCK